MENMNQIYQASNEEAKLVQEVSSVIEQLDDMSTKLEGFMKTIF